MAVQSLVMPCLGVNHTNPNVFWHEVVPGVDAGNLVSATVPVYAPVCARAALDGHIVSDVRR